MTSHGYPAGMRAFPAWARTCHHSLGSGPTWPTVPNGGHGCRAASRARTTGDPVFRCRRGVIGQKAQWRQRGRAEVHGTPGPQDQDKREETANG